MMRGTSRNGVDYAVVAKAEHLESAAQDCPGAVLFTMAELSHCRWMSADEADAVMMTKAAFAGATVVSHKGAA
jgi:ABC-type xylose transport system substrate-binding protein